MFAQVNFQVSPVATSPHHGAEICRPSRGEAPLQRVFLLNGRCDEASHLPAGVLASALLLVPRANAGEVGNG